VTIFISTFYLALALIFYLFPAKKINNLYGYRTKRSKKDKKSWTFAQKKSGSLMLVFASIIFVLSFIFHKSQYAIWAAILMVFSLLLLIVMVEKALKERLND